MQKDYYAALDSLLESLQYPKAQDVAAQQIAQRIPLYQTDFSKEEIATMYQKLVKDGFAQHFINILEEDDYEITLEGYVFIQEGMYTKQNKMTLADFRYKRLASLFLVFGAATAGIYYTIELVRWYYYLIVKIELPYTLIPLTITALAGWLLWRRLYRYKEQARQAIKDFFLPFDPMKKGNSSA